MIDVVLSKDGVSVRLTDERWSHIVEEHNELAGLRFDILSALAEPDRVLAGSDEEKLAVKEYDQESGWW